MGVEILERIERGQGAKADIDQLDELYQFIGPNSFCALAPGAAEPIKGLIRHFRGLMEEHVTGRGCPFKSSREAIHA